MKSFRQFAIVCLFALCWGVATSAYGQRAWEKKPYQQWSMSDVLNILTNSPWAQTQDEEVRIDYGLPPNSYTAIIRLRSALPIRQALLRQKQLLMNYDKFSSADKTRFDHETSEFLSCSDCGKHYLVTLSSPVVADDARPFQIPRGFDIVQVLARASMEELKRHVHLVNDKGEERKLAQFVPPKKEGAEAMFVFERFDEHGKALISMANKRFFFRIDEKLFEKRSVPLKRFTFEVARLVRNAEIVF
jgi:hypothetical protein